MAQADSGYWFGSAINLGLSRALDPFFDRMLRSFLFRRAVRKAAGEQVGSSSFLRGFDSKALDAQADMEALAEMIRNSAELSTLTRQTPANQLIDKLANHPDGLTALFSLLAGAMLLLWGLADRNGVATFSGIITLVAGTIFGLDEIVQLIMTSSWIDLAIFGAGTIALGSIIDRHGVVIKMRLVKWFEAISERRSRIAFDEEL